MPRSYRAYWLVFGILVTLLSTVPLWNDDLSQRRIITPAWAQGQVWSDLADTSVGSVAVQVVPRNSARIALVCTNTSTNIALRLGSATVSTTRGVQLQPKGTLMFTGTAAMFAVAESGTVTLACSEELK